MSSAPKDDLGPEGRRTWTRAWWTLGLRLATWYVAVTLASFATLAAVIPVMVRAWAERESQRSTEGALERYRREFEAGGTDALRAMFDCRSDARSNVVLRLSDAQNIELFRVSSDDESDHLATVLSDGRAPLARGEPREGWHVAGVSVSQGRQLEIMRHDDSTARAWTKARTSSLMILAFGLTSAVLGAFIITRRALRPIGDLARATQDIIDSGNLSLRVHSRGTSDSLDQLGSLVNRMLARNEALVRAMKESLDNVAHDLRTPLTRLRVGAELALRNEGDAAAATEALAGVVEESDRVLAVLTALMDVTEAETGSMHLDRRPEDLAAIARDAVDLYDLVSTERGVHIVTRLEPGVNVWADRARIRQVCANLLDNAIKYTPAGGRVEVIVARGEDSGILTVEDTGMGISAEEAPHIWSRLYRGSRSRGEHGLGLGLSLVKAVVEAHGGTVGLQSGRSQGSAFEVRLPRHATGTARSFSTGGNT